MNASPHVLIVDDDPDVVDAIEMALETQGYHCHHASNGRKALELVAESPPGIVLLDMEMPIMSGWECARALHAAYGRTVPVVIVTASEHADLRAVDIDADGVLAKPFELSELLAVVSQFVAPPRDRRVRAAQSG